MPQDEIKNKFTSSATPEQTEAKSEVVQTDEPTTGEAIRTETELVTEKRESKTANESSKETTMDALKHRLHISKKIPPSIPQVRDELTLRVEKIMEENMGEAFAALPEVKKQEFKIAGERTALAIRELLKSAHIKIKKVFRLILEWLLLLPGINRFYLEKEAKIKADKIVSLKKNSQV